MVDNAENLHRSVPDSDEYFKNVDGKCVFNSSAFNARDSKPSVDREILRPDPVQSKLSDSDGIVALTAEKIRRIGAVTHEVAKAQVIVHKIDVIPDPVTGHPELPDNPSHALIVANPEYASKGIFRKLRVALALLATEAGWRVKPASWH